MHYLKKIDSALKKGETLFAVFMLSMMVCVSFSLVCLRILSSNLNITYANALLKQFDWSQPLVRLLVLWVTFVGASMVTRDDKHIRINLLGAMLGGRVSNLLNIIISGASLTLSLFLLKASIGYLMVEISYGDVLFLGVPAWLAHMIIPAGFMSISARFAIRFVKNLHGYGKLV